jgi:hypothetical protein
MNKPAETRPLRGIALLVLAACAGCCGYRLGSSLPPGVRSVHVPAFVNACGEPQVEAETTRAAIQEFQRDGALRIATADTADAVVKVTVLRCALEPLRYDRQQVRTAAEYRLTLVAHLVLERRGTGETLVDTLVNGEATFSPVPDLASTKAAAIAVAARDLAHSVVVGVVESW